VRLGPRDCGARSVGQQSWGRARLELREPIWAGSGEECQGSRSSNTANGTRPSVGAARLLYVDDIDYWERVANEGDVEAMVHLGQLLSDSDSDRSMMWLNRAAEGGHVCAMCMVAHKLSISAPERSRKLFTEAAGQGSTYAMVGLGRLLHQSDPESAARWYTTAAEAGDPAAMHALGHLLHKRHKRRLALTWFQKAGEAGHTPAMVDIATRLMIRRWFSLTGRRKQREEEMRWLTRAAEGGNVEAMLSLAIDCGARDDKSGLHQWLHAAADQGHRPSAVALEKAMRGKASPRSLGIHRPRQLNHLHWRMPTTEH
jgi:TPR repeat protein